MKITEFVSNKVFRDIFTDLATKGREVSPRGQLVKEIENYSFVLPPFVRFQNFECRKFNLDYLKTEFAWYLKGDRHDLSITKHAKIWKNIVNEDQTLNSNYGQYIFGDGNQFDRALGFLSEDNDSRRASIMILGRDHVISETNDLPCTYGMNFRIREGRLNMSVHMRSQDAIFGMGNDIPTFSFIHEMLLNALRQTYPTLEYGNYFHVVDSFHVYNRHFEMLKSIVTDYSPYTNVSCPEISGPDEVKFLRKLDFSDVPERFAFSRWLSEREKRAE